MTEDEIHQLKNLMQRVRDELRKQGAPNRLIDWTLEWRPIVSFLRHTAARKDPKNFPTDHFTKEATT